MKRLLSLVMTLGAVLSCLAAGNGWVQVRIPVACIRDGKGHSTEMTSQAIMGTPLRLLDGGTSEWLHIESPEGYKGYMNISSVAEKTDAEMKAWRQAPRLTVTSPRETIVYASRDGRGPRDVVTELVNGSIVEGSIAPGDSLAAVTLPDGRAGWARAADMTPTERWADQTFDREAILDMAYSLMGAPYLWGGMSTKAVDCSGLVRVAYFTRGIILRRDASQQIHTGIKLAPTDTASLRGGDLMFFSYVPGGRISHVALYDRDGRYIHSSGRVKVNAMSADDEDFSHRVYRGASRIEGAIPSEGITRVIDHPWYFEK